MSDGGTGGKPAMTPTGVKPAGDKLFAGSIPEIYDRLMVPLIFEPYARDIAARVAARAPNDVLEIACGTGAVTRMLAQRLPAATRIVATDLNRPMLDHAARRVTDARVTWRQADALALPFDDGTFDAVVCQFGAMFFPDKVAGYREARRVMRPGGVFLFNVWDRIEDNVFADVVTRALATVFPDDPPRFMARTPHGYHDEGAIRGHVTAAGFADVTIEAIEFVSRAAMPREVAIAYCQGTPLRTEIEARGSLEKATDAAAEALARECGKGPIEGKIRALVVEGKG